MPIKIYRVKYLEKFKGSSEWCPSELDVSTKGDAVAAVKKVRANIVGSKVPISEDGKRMAVITAIKPTGVELLAESSI